MNTAHGSHTDKLKELVQSLGFSPNNQALALEYLTAETCDDALLTRAEPQDFSTLGWPELSGSVDWLARVRSDGDPDLAARYVKLYWAIGRSTAVFPLGQCRLVRSGLCERSDLIAILGRPAAAAMEAERCARTNHPAYEETAWLHQLARTEPETLEEAQGLCGSPLANMKIFLEGVLLCNAGQEKPRFLKKLLGQNSLVDRQAELLFRSNVDSLANTAPALSQEDRNLLAGYIQKGDPKAPLPFLSSVRCAIDAHSALTANASDPYLTQLLGTASFLAQCQDPRARCAVRVYLALNPMTLLDALLRTASHQYFMEQRSVLTQDLPGGPAILLLALCRSSISYADKRGIASQCRSGLTLAKQLSDARQYEILCTLLSDNTDSTAEEKIITHLEKYVQAGKSELRAYLTGTGSLSDSAVQLAAVTASPYTYPTAPANLIFNYRLMAGWDNFACRCAVVFGLVLRARGMGNILRQGGGSVKEKDVSTLAAALLEQELPIPQLLQVFDALHDSSYVDNIKAGIRNGVVSAIQRPEYVAELCDAAKSGGVFARHTAISALDGLTATEACAAQAKAGLLDCAGDSSKQIQELLLAILPAHTDWTEDFARMLKSKKAAERLLAVGVSRKLGDALRPALEEALAAEKSAKVVDAIRTALGQEGAGSMESSKTPDELAAQVLKGGKTRKIQWVLDAPLPALHRKDGAEAGEDRRAALMVAYCELGRVGRSETAAELAKDLDEADLAALAHEVYEKWLAEGAQSKTKWVLPFAAAFGGPAMTPKLTRAIHDWPQHSRGAIACDAVAALALSPDPAALLTVDAISRKFKFRQVKTAAGQALENAAKELGITAEELADRIVPDLGFDPNGTRVFDYGPRSFTVRLTPTLELEITNDGGKTVKNLPAPGKTDDEEKANAAYHEFKLMKKQIKTAVTTQKARLEAALSALRCWSAEAWRALFVQNPIMHQFAISLIWGVYEDGNLQTTFRYMEDGSFNTVDEEEYQLPDGAKIGLAHPVELDAETLEGWKRQLEDYEITQSILQLDRPVYRLEPGMEQARSLERFGGKMLNGLSLSGKLQGLGWYRGSVQDAGVFYTFYREDAALNMGVELNFSGCYVGGENDTVTVYEAVFYRSGTVQRGSYCYDTPKKENTFTLGDVPPRYYSEIVYQLERATASASESDPNWKSNYS